MRKYKVVLLSKGIYNEIIEADYMIVKENSGVSVFFSRKYQYNDPIEDTIIATAPPTAFIIQINDEL